MHKQWVPIGIVFVALHKAWSSLHSTCACQAERQCVLLEHSVRSKVHRARRTGQVGRSDASCVGSTGANQIQTLMCCGAAAGAGAQRRERWARFQAAGAYPGGC